MCLTSAQPASALVCGHEDPIKLGESRLLLSLLFPSPLLLTLSPIMCIAECTHTHIHTLSLSHTHTHAHTQVLSTSSAQMSAHFSTLCPRVSISGSKINVCVPNEPLQAGNEQTTNSDTSEQSGLLVLLVLLVIQLSTCDALHMSSFSYSACLLTHFEKTDE